MMRICLISEEFPPETGWGGIGTHTYNLSLALSQLGHDIEVVSKSVDGKESLLQKDNLRVYRIPDNDSSVTIRALVNAAPRIQKHSLLSGFAEYPLRTLRRGAAIGRWLKSRPPFDIIEAPDYGAETFWCQFVERQRTPVIVKLHTPLFLTQRLNAAPLDDLSVKLRKWMERHCITHSTKLISPTKSLADLIADEFRIEDIEVVPNCVDTNFFTATGQNRNSKERLIIYAGRLERRKGVEILAKAIPLVVRTHPNIRFLFLGRDTPTAEGRTSMKAWLVSHLAQAGVLDQVEFVDEVPRTNIVTYFEQADICVLPSLWENLPYTCLESMACGTPVIGSNVGGFPEIITDGLNGMLFKAGDHEDLAAKIKKMITTDRLDDLGRNARERIVSTYSLNVIANMTVKLYEQVLRG